MFRASHFIFVLSLASIRLKVVTSQHFTHYKKPKPSNGPCIDSIEHMFSTMERNTGMKCLSCTKRTKATCDLGCQEHIDAIYRNCDGVTLPRHYFFDPPVSNDCSLF
jgi:hypothetical protein